MTVTTDTQAASQDFKATGAGPKLTEAIVNTFTQSAAERIRNTDLTALRADMRVDLAQLE